MVDELQAIPVNDFSQHELRDVTDLYNVELFSQKRNLFHALSPEDFQVLTFVCPE